MVTEPHRGILINLSPGAKPDVVLDGLSALTSGIKWFLWRMGKQWPDKAVITDFYHFILFTTGMVVLDRKPAGAVLERS